MFSLKLSNEALTHSADELAGQLIGRIHGYGEATVNMVAEAREFLSSTEIDDDVKKNVEHLLRELEQDMKKIDEKQKVR